MAPLLEGAPQKPSCEEGHFSAPDGHQLSGSPHGSGDSQPGT